MLVFRLMVPFLDTAAYYKIGSFLWKNLLKTPPRKLLLFSTPQAVKADLIS